MATLMSERANRKGLPTQFSYKLTASAGASTVNVSTAIIKSGKHYLQVSIGHFSSSVLSPDICIDCSAYTRVLLHAQQY
jgi:hypothetical protein